MPNDRYNIMETEEGSCRRSFQEKSNKRQTCGTQSPPGQQAGIALWALVVYKGVAEREEGVGGEEWSEDVVSDLTHHLDF